MPRLYNWYIEKIKGSDEGSELWARGIVSGHERLADGMFIHTSPIMTVTIEDEIVIIQTKNTRYECSMENADYDRFTESKIIADFEVFREKYDVPKEKYVPELEENAVLLVLGNNRHYYFDSYHVNYNGKCESMYDVHPHIGMFQDSVLCMLYFEDRCVDYRYFPFKRCHVEFYSWEDDFKTYVENCGDDPLYISFSGSVYKVSPKERTLLSVENAEKERISLCTVDLYDVWGRENEQNIILHTDTFLTQ